MELGDAGFAAELHFLALVDLGNWVAHGAELVVCDDAHVTVVGFHIGCRATVGGTGAEKNREACDADTEELSCFHLSLVLGFGVLKGFWPFSQK